MAEQLITGSIAAPGFFGLNTQDSSVQLSEGFALEANNCVVDQYGRIGSRKGWTPINSTSFNGGKVRTVFEFVKADNNLLFAAANNQIYGNIPNTNTYAQYPVANVHFYTGTYAQSGTTVTVTTVDVHGLTTGQTVWFDATSGGVADGFFVITSTPSSKVFTFTLSYSATDSGNCLGVDIITDYSITDDNWQVAAMPYGTGLTASAHAIWVQSGHIPLVLHKLGSVTHLHQDGYGFQRLGDVGNLPVGYTVSSFKPSCSLYAFGRLWVANTDPSDTQTVYFSDLKNPSEWQTGTSGKLDISSVIQTGDPITAIAQHNNFIIFFTSKSIIVYSGASNPSTMALSDVITGVGCIARDTVQSVAGTDLLFLSATGVQSLQRVIQEKSLPFRDVSKNVRDNLINLVNSDVLANIKAAYYPTDAHYLLSLPGSGTTFCFDTRGMLESGASRATVWKQINPTAFCVTADRKLYLGEVGYIGYYNGYLDNGNSYRMSYYTNYFDFGQPTQTKILKKINLVAIGGSSQAVAFKWGFDYTSNYKSGTILLDAMKVYEYGTAEYGIAEFSNGIALDMAQIQAGGSGKVVQLGFESDINNTPLSIQKIDFGLKQGKTLL